MALASKTPTQMGSTVSLAMSLRTTMGMLVDRVQHEATDLDLDVGLWSTLIRPRRAGCWEGLGDADGLVAAPARGRSAMGW